MPSINFSLPVALVLVQALLASTVTADLRMASKPQGQFQTIQRNNAVKFATTEALYMKPSTFNYQGLKNQEQNNNDNFLRSNIDNEQDNRNFQNEPGKDMLPFRTLEAASAGAAITVAPGVEQTTPLRWNNPHASEMEVNIWIMNNSIVVPVKKPVCSGEGRQDSVVTYTIPADFNTKVAATVPGFTGCNKVGDCTLQIYAHSVEPRTYAIGTPIIIPGFDANAPKAADASGIAPATKDPGADISKQPRDTCLPMADPTSNIASAQPQYARLVSDVFNHAYQNSDYSPYSGQQQEAISKNMQAATILRMTAANRGELGKAALDQSTKDYLAKLIAKVNGVVTKFEQAANNIINNIQNQAQSKNTGTVGNQQLANCFRCVEVASVNTQRLTTTTYIPSFALPAAQAAAAKAKLNAGLKSLVSADNVVQIYVAALNEVKPDFEKAALRGIKYQPAMVKTTATTMADVTQFRKVDANGKADGGKYAATQAFRAAGVRYLAALEDGSDEFDGQDSIPTPEGAALQANPDDTPQPDGESDGATDSTSSASSVAVSASASVVVAAVAFFQL